MIFFFAREKKKKKLDRTGSWLAKKQATNYVKVGGISSRVDLLNQWAVPSFRVETAYYRSDHS